MDRGLALAAQDGVDGAVKDAEQAAAVNIARVASECDVDRHGCRVEVEGRERLLLQLRVRRIAPRKGPGENEPAAAVVCARFAKRGGCCRRVWEAARQLEKARGGVGANDLLQCKNAQPEVVVG